MRHERLLKEAEKDKDDVWKIQDEESDDEIREKMKILLGP